MGFANIYVGNSSQNVRNDKLRTLGNEIEEDAMSLVHEKKHKLFTGFLGIIEGNGPPTGITNPRRQTAHTNRKETP